MQKEKKPKKTKEIVVKEEPSEPVHKPRHSHDVSEGKTIFIKNVPFSTTNAELKAAAENFGPVEYALICMDRLTEYSKGTAFVKFQNQEDAEKCLSASIELSGQTLELHRALDRQEIADSKSRRVQGVKDGRNLYLVKEGVILAGSPAAVGISTTDMAKRLQLEQWKSQMLRNLNMFVSRIRLVVHNLPEKLDDATLRQLFKNHAGPNAVITEARVMRDLRNPDANGVGKSKGIGFVAFTSHEDALKALRSLNNNPNIFSSSKRPIIAFSIENRVIVNAKKRRIEKSRENNPMLKEKRRDTDDSSEPPKKKPTPAKVEDASTYCGVMSKPGTSGKLRSKFKLKTQAAIHQQSQKAEKKKQKAQRRLQAVQMMKKEARKDVKPKQKKPKHDANEQNFNKIVADYKSKLSSVKTSKWYES